MSRLHSCKMATEMEPCPGSSHYMRAVDPSQRFVGRGGACLGVEKWWDTKKQCWVAVKHLGGSSRLVQPELQVLRHIADQAIPRAVATIAEERNGPKSVYVVLELVQGMTLAEYCYESVKQGQLAASENRMLPVAAQLLDTLQALHGRACVAHLDLTSNNVMLRHDAVGPWDNVRLIDFGLSRSCQAGVKDVVPKGLTPDFAGPEVLRSYFKSFTDPDCPSREVDGQATDVYSVGVVLFEMLTGCTPFPANSTDHRQIKVPGKVPQQCRELWQMAVAVLKLQTTWVRALSTLNGDKPQHPILDRIRRCSSTPDEAVDFFTRMLHSTVHMRPTAAQALAHPYIRRCAGEMRTYLESQAAISQDLPALEEVRAIPGKRKLLVRVGGAVREQGGRLARSAGHVLKRLPLFKGHCHSASNVSSGSASSSDSSSSSSSKPPLSAYFFIYKHQVELHSPRQAHQEASIGGAGPCRECNSESPRRQQPQGFLHTSGKGCSRALNVRACTSRQPAGTHQQTSDVLKVFARQALMPVGQVGQTGHPKQPDPVQKEQAASALSAEPAATPPPQANLKQSPAERAADDEQSTPVLSPSRPKRHGWMKKLAVAGVVASVGCLLYSSRS